MLDAGRGSGPQRGPSGPNVGLWRSTDSGQTWQLQNVPAGLAGAFSVQDAALDPTNSNIVYAAVRSTGVFKSVNAKAAAAVDARMSARCLGRSNDVLGWD